MIMYTASCGTTTTNANDYDRAAIPFQDQIIKREKGWQQQHSPASSQSVSVVFRILGIGENDDDDDDDG